MTDTLQVVINGATQPVPEGLNVASLLAHLGIAGNRVAIERNLDILPRSKWGQTAVLSGDTYEIVHLVGGGDRSPRAI
jgi:sulfur carrier protein